MDTSARAIPCQAVTFCSSSAAPSRPHPAQHRRSAVFRLRLNRGHATGRVYVVLCFMLCVIRVGFLSFRTPPTHNLIRAHRTSSSPASVTSYLHKCCRTTAWKIVSNPRGSPVHRGGCSSLTSTRPLPVVGGSRRSTGASESRLHQHPYPPLLMRCNVVMLVTSHLSRVASLANVSNMGAGKASVGRFIEPVQARAQGWWQWSTR